MTRIGLVGCGHIGTVHSYALRQLGAGRIKGAELGMIDFGRLRKIVPQPRRNGCHFCARLLQRHSRLQPGNDVVVFMAAHLALVLRQAEHYVGAIIAYAVLILVPAWGCYGRWWERFAASFMTLFILATLAGIGAGIGGLIIINWGQ